MKQALQAGSAVSTLVTSAKAQGVDLPAPTASSHEKRRAAERQERVCEPSAARKAGTEAAQRCPDGSGITDRTHAPASPPLVASDEMTPLGPANRHPAIPQKLPTSKQPTPPAAPASTPSLSSTLIVPNPLSLNLTYINPPSQTGDSHLVAYTTIDSNRKEKVQQQQRSPSVKFGGQSHAVAGYFTRSLGVCLEDEVSHSGRRVCEKVFASFGMLQRQPFSAYCNHSRYCHPLLEHVG